MTFKTIVARCLLSLLLLLTGSLCGQNELRVYPAPKGATLSDDFSVQVRSPGDHWQNLDEYVIKVDRVTGVNHSEQEASMAFFDFAGRVEVKVTSNKGVIDSARVRPLSYGIEYTVDGNSLTFTLDKPSNLSVEVNGDIFHNLHLWANPMLEEVPDRNDDNVVYLGPGIHEFPGDSLAVRSGQTVYIDGSAVLRGPIVIDRAHDVKVIGRGIVDHTIRHGIQIKRSRNVLVEGIFATQCSTGGSDSVVIRNVKSISYYGWGDGMNIFASNNVLFDRVFCRNSDDCTTVYGTRLGFKGPVRNITMQNSTLWADVAHPIFIGIHGNSAAPETLQDLTYRNIDILDHKEKQLDYQGCLAINAGDNNTIRNVLFEDIRVEDFREGQLVNLRIFYNKKYCTAPGIGIDSITFRNINYRGANANISIISGYDQDRKVRNITFEDLTVNGRKIYDGMPGKPGWYKTGDMGGIYVGEHVENVVFKLSEEAKFEADRTETEEK